MQVLPYLSFEGRCEEALEFYKKAIGARVEMLMHFKDAPADAGEPPEGCAGPMPPADKVMHSSFRVGASVVMATDGMASGKADFKGISLSLNADNEAHADKLFAALSEGGQVQMPMAKTFFAKKFGMVADKFGVCWMIIAE
ncbi:VOC family protein [Undibacter mobilis]|uniref:VOC family protein n=1 Tax=Undibacter mobilis TaxID=2292256 RepID=A0A371B984_9BRAD|nr:VOC family protein [Undibacter mobilis]RDV04156.1 VOC family protein [Undibacter mobilis]